MRRGQWPEKQGEIRGQEHLRSGGSTAKCTVIICYDLYHLIQFVLSPAASGFWQLSPPTSLPCIKAAHQSVKMCQVVSSINVKFVATHRISMHKRAWSRAINLCQCGSFRNGIISPISVKGPGLANGRHLLLGVCPCRKQKVGTMPMQADASSFLRNLVK